MLLTYDDLGNILKNHRNNNNYQIFINDKNFNIEYVRTDIRTNILFTLFDNPLYKEKEKEVIESINRRKERESSHVRACNIETS